jgi:hypothetical protein
MDTDKDINTTMATDLYSKRNNNNIINMNRTHVYMYMYIDTDRNRKWNNSLNMNSRV